MVENATNHDASADNPRKGLSSCALKIIGFLLVMVGTASTALLQGQIADLDSASISELTYAVLTDAVSWCAIPIYSWLLVNGFRHTHSPGWYLARLAILAVISEVPYDLATSHSVFDMSSQNPVWGLCIALIVLIVLNAFQGRSDVASWGIRVAVLLAALMWVFMFNVGVRLGLVNEGLLVLAFALVFWLLPRRENTMMFTAGALGAVTFILPALGVMILHWRSNRKGYSAPWVQWVFYVIYPLHLLVFGLIAL